MDYRQFKSGSDIRGIAIGDPQDPLYMSDEMVMRTACAFADWLAARSSRRPLRISVGHDSRLSAERIKRAVLSALVAKDVEAVDLGLCSTPAMFLSTLEADLDGAIQITASHHPKDRNGLKFFTPRGGLEGSDIAALLEAAAAMPALQAGDPEACICGDFIDRYATILKEQIINGVNAADRAHPLAGLRIVVDAGNGVGGFYARQVLRPLGADVSGSLYLEPDGNFPHHAPNPENAEAMHCVSAATAAADADFGVIFDTDVDRAALVGKGGFEINRNRLVALAAAVALRDCPGGVIVTDSVTSDGLAAFIEEKGGKHLRFRRGYRNVINKQIELCEAGVPCPLAMETSGHAAFADNYYLDDGAYLITRLIIEAASLAKQGKTLESLIDGLAEPAEETELRFRITQTEFRPVGEAVIAHLTAAAQTHTGWTPAADNHEGIRINSAAGQGWFLLRMSVHDPILVLNAESDAPGGIKKMLREVADALRVCPAMAQVDAASLDAALAKEA
ncbi:MAG: phosphomannomutase/phosphoglucomutase [Clostridia bacterium]|nr:phosphomannomutase/phosphoglucomutase [Clostridia bacterium]